MTDLRKAAEIALDALERCEYGVISDGRLKDTIQALRQALAQPEQEQYVTKVVAVHEDGTYTTERTPLPKREWVGVTYDEVYEFVCTTDSYINFAKAIEAKLKEKNI